MKRSFYEVLRVPHNADTSQIDTAYALATEKLKSSSLRGTGEAAIEAQLIRDGYQILSDPAKRAKAIVLAATHFNDPKVLLEVSENLTGAMKGLAVARLDEAHLLQTRGW